MHFHFISKDTDYAIKTSGIFTELCHEKIFNDTGFE